MQARLPIFAVAATALTLAVSSGARADIPPQVTVNHSPVQFDGQPPIEQGGRVLVPLRGVMEKLGAYVQFDSRTQTVIALRGSIKITLPIGSRQATVGDRAVQLDVPAQIVNGSTLVPLRFVAESLGARVAFDPQTNLVAIQTQGRADSAVFDDRGPGRHLPPPPLNGAPPLEGTVVSVLDDKSPPRIVVHTPEDGGKDRTIPLRGNANITMRRPDGDDRPIEVRQIHTGERVSIMLSDDGRAQSVRVLRGGDDHRPGPPPNPAEGDTFRGELASAKPVGEHSWLLRTTEGREITVSGDVTVLLADQRLRVGDLRSGDRLNIAVDPATKRGTRIIVSR